MKLLKAIRQNSLQATFAEVWGWGGGGVGGFMSAKWISCQDSDSYKLLHHPDMISPAAQVTMLIGKCYSADQLLASIVDEHLHATCKVLAWQAGSQQHMHPSLPQQAGLSRLYRSGVPLAIAMQEQTKMYDKSLCMRSTASGLGKLCGGALLRGQFQPHQQQEWLPHGDHSPGPRGWA